MRPALGGWDGKGHFRHTKCPSENTSPVCSVIFKSRWEMKCFALRLCSVLKDLLGLEQVFILNYGDPIHSAQGCLLNSILRRALIRNIQGRAWVQREGEGWRKDPGDIQGAVLLLLKPTDQSHPQPFLPPFPPISHGVSTPTITLVSPHLHLHCSMSDGTNHSFFFQHNSWDKQLLLMTFLKLRA